MFSSAVNRPGEPAGSPHAALSLPGDAYIFKKRAYLRRTHNYGSAQGSG
jgi:hypothetical protein